MKGWVVMSKIRASLAVFAAMGVAAPAGVAAAQAAGLRSAQAASDDLFARDRAIAVRERAHEGYEARGVPAGAFTLYPRLQFEAEHTDNLYASATSERSDLILRLRPEVSLESGWARHALALFARGAINRHQDYGTEDSESWTAGFDGRVDVSRATNLAAGASIGEQVEPRTSSNAPSASIEPIQYEMAQAYAAASRTTGRLRLSGRADVRSFDYQDGRDISGAVIDQDDRDRTIRSLSGRADYAISPATAIFAQVTGNDRDYDMASTPLVAARDSSGYEFLVGVNFELGAVSRGEIAVGYIEQEFDSAAYSRIDGFGARAQIEWFPTELTTVTTAASRTIEDAGMAGAGGYLSSALSLTVDHELLRNVILSGQLAYTMDDYNDIDRDDDRFNASVGGTYLLNRNLGLTVSASHMEQSSSGAGRGVDYTVNRLMVALVAQF